MLDGIRVIRREELGLHLEGFDVLLHGLLRWHQIFKIIFLYLWASAYVAQTSLLHLCLLLSSLLLFLGFDVGNDSLLSLLELLNDLLLSWNLSLHPWVVDDICDGWSLDRFKLQHGLNQRLEVLGVEFLLTWLVFAMGLPEQVGPIGGEAPVEWVLEDSLGEWRMLGNHDEKNNG